METEFPSKRKRKAWKENNKTEDRIHALVDWCFMDYSIQVFCFLEKA